MVDLSCRSRSAVSNSSVHDETGAEFPALAAGIGVGDYMDFVYYSLSLLCNVEC